MKNYQLWWQLLLEVFRQVAGGEHGTSADQQCYHSQARAGQGLRVSPPPFYHYAHLWTYSGRTGEEKVWLPIAITLYLYLDKIQRVNKEELGSDSKNFSYWKHSFLTEYCHTQLSPCWKSVISYSKSSTIYLHKVYQKENIIINIS